MIKAVSGLSLSTSASTPSELAQSYGSWDGIRTNHVINSTGSFFDANGSSRGISTTEDLELLIELRKHSDLLIVDAATARLEKYRKTSFAHLAIVSATGNFEGIPAAKSLSGVTLFSPLGTDVLGRGATEHVQISPDEPFRGILDWATLTQMNSLLLESGPTLTRLAFESNCVTQSAITITPGLPSGVDAVDMNPFSKKGQLISVATGEGAIFTLWSY